MKLIAPNYSIDTHNIYLELAPVPVLKARALRKRLFDVGPDS